MPCEKDQNKNQLQKGVCKIHRESRSKIIDIARTVELKEALTQLDRWLATNDTKIINVFGVWSKDFKLAVEVIESSRKYKVRYATVGKDRCFTRALAQYNNWLKYKKNICIISTAIFSHIYIEVVVFFEEIEETPKKPVGFI